VSEWASERRGKLIRTAAAMLMTRPAAAAAAAALSSPASQLDTGASVRRSLAAGAP